MRLRAGPGSQGLSHPEPGAGQLGCTGAAPAPGIEHSPGDGDGLRPGRDVGLWVGSAQQGPWLGRAGLWGAVALLHGLTALGG